MIVKFLGGPQDGEGIKVCDDCVVEGHMYPDKKMPCYMLLADLVESDWVYVWTPFYAGMKDLESKIIQREIKRDSD